MPACHDGTGLINAGGNSRRELQGRKSRVLGVVMSRRKPRPRRVITRRLIPAAGSEDATQAEPWGLAKRPIEMSCALAVLGERNDARFVPKGMGQSGRYTTL